MPLLISTVVMFQAQNRDYLKSYCVLKDHDYERIRRPVFHNKIANLQNQDHVAYIVQDQDRFLPRHAMRKRCRLAWKNLRFSTEIAVYLGNGTR